MRRRWGGQVEVAVEVGVGVGVGKGEDEGLGHIIVRAESFA